MNRFLAKTPVGIRFADYLFSDPVPLGRFSLPPRAAGLYAVLMPDPSWDPWHLQPLFFGEFGDQQDAHMSQAQQICCLRVAAGRALYVAVYTLPQQHEWEASRIKKELIERYRPVSNLDLHDTNSEIGERLKGLEKRILEQDAVLKLALAALGQMVQLQPEPKRKIVGFQPNRAG